MKNYYRFLILVAVGLLTATVATAQEHFTIGYTEVDEPGIYFKVEMLDDEPSNLSMYIEATYLFPKLNRTFWFEDGSVHSFNIKGKGQAVAIGLRKYFSKKQGAGFFAGTEIKYSHTKYDDSLLKGKYSYLSLVAPEIGYKQNLGSSLFLEAFLGTEWGLKLKRSDVFPSDLFDDWKFKIGLGVGYKL